MLLSPPMRRVGAQRPERAGVAPSAAPRAAVASEPTAPVGLDAEALPVQLPGFAGRLSPLSGLIQGGIERCEATEGWQAGGALEARAASQTPPKPSPPVRLAFERTLPAGADRSARARALAQAAAEALTGELDQTQRELDDALKGFAEELAPLLALPEAEREAQLSVLREALQAKRSRLGEAAPEGPAAAVCARLDAQLELIELLSDGAA